MMQQWFRRPAAALLAALVFILSACAPRVQPDPDSTAGGPPVPTSQEAPSSSPPESSPSIEPSQSPSPVPDKSDEPSQSPTPEQSQAPGESTPPDPTDSPAPSETPAPSQSVPPEDSQPPALSGSTGEGEDVGNDWFSDAVFLGDSRTDGLRLYSGIKGASFICHTGLSVFTVGKNACINSDQGKITAMEALAKEQWAKVYLMLGVNELGYSTTSFKNAYTAVVEQIKQLQPGASIYLQTLIPVNEPIAYEHGTSRAINNEKLKQFNQVIAEIAQEQNVLLVDVDTPFWSEEGCLAAENTGDGVHLTRAGYQTWFAYLRTHTAPTGSAASAPSSQPESILPTAGPAEGPVQMQPPVQANPAPLITPVTVEPGVLPSYSVE